MTPIFPTPDHYIHNLLTMNSSEAKRLWRRAIKEHFGYTCVYCGEYYDEFNLTLDHIIPRCMGGRNEVRNLIPSCKQCNRSKGSNNWLAWMRATFGENPNKEQLILSWIK